MIITVTGPLPVAQAGVTDAHNHIWIDPVPGGAVDAPVLEDMRIAEELSDYRQAGGGMIIDCQPPGCGRNGNRLYDLSIASDVQVVAVTGFHRRRYYPPDAWLLQASQASASHFFIQELSRGLAECCDCQDPPKAGLVKIACEASLDDTPQLLMEAAVEAAVEMGAALAVHTERGAQAEKIVSRLNGLGLPSDRLVLFHMDKRPDLALHFELAGQGVLLEYDTFYREKYSPQTNLWPLLEAMVARGWDTHIVVGTDMAETQMWSRLGGAPGLTGLFTQIIPQMHRRGFSQDAIRRMTGENIAARLASHLHPNIV